MKRFLAIVAAALILALLAACGSPKDSGDSSVTSGSGTEQEQPEKLLEQGDVIRLEDNRLLVTAYVDRDGAPYVEAYSLRLTDDTVLEDAEGRTLGVDELEAGARVEVWSVGPIAESYPAQGEAARIVVLADPASGEGNVTRTEAVRAALERLDESAMAPAVQSAEWDEDMSLWHIRLVHQQSIDEPVEVKVDGASGRVIVADNDAFRVFAPEPKTEVGPSFTVEGKARVFEAVFHWTLEDGHIILAEGMEMADGGAPAWGDFRFDVSYDKATQQNMMLILYIHSPKDGSVENELIVPLMAPDHLIDHNIQ
jgi:hypothetical protein